MEKKQLGKEGNLTKEQYDSTLESFKIACNKQYTLYPQDLNIILESFKMGMDYLIEAQKPNIQIVSQSAEQKNAHSIAVITNCIDNIESSVRTNAEHIKQISEKIENLTNIISNDKSSERLSFSILEIEKELKQRIDNALTSLRFDYTELKKSIKRTDKNVADLTGNCMDSSIKNTERFENFKKATNASIVEVDKRLTSLTHELINEDINLNKKFDLAKANIDNLFHAVNMDKVWVQRMGNLEGRIIKIERTLNKPKKNGTKTNKNKS